MDIISRNAAKAAGLKYYFTGQPCEQGHVCEWFVSSYQCKQCSYTRSLRIYHSKKSKSPRTCRHCGAPIDSRDRRARYCNVECRRLYRRDVAGDHDRQMESAHKKRNQSRINALIRQRYANDVHFRNSRNADNKRRLALNPERTRQSKRRHASTRRANKKRAFVEIVDPKVVFDRDKGHCGICTKEVSGRDWEIDHIVPLSKGGLHAYANVQLAHKQCNRLKSARMPTGQIGLFQVIAK